MPTKRPSTPTNTLRMLMRADANDARGSGMGYREPKDEWRVELVEASAVSHRKVYGWAPTQTEFRVPPRRIAQAAHLAQTPAYD